MVEEGFEITTGRQEREMEKDGKRYGEWERKEERKSKMEG